MRRKEYHMDKDSFTYTHTVGIEGKLQSNYFKSFMKTYISERETEKITGKVTLLKKKDDVSLFEYKITMDRRAILNETFLIIMSEELGLVERLGGLEYKVISPREEFIETYNIIKQVMIDVCTKVEQLDTPLFTNIITDSFNELVDVEKSVYVLIVKCLERIVEDFMFATYDMAIENSCFPSF